MKNLLKTNNKPPLISHEVPLSLFEESQNFNDYDYCLIHLTEESDEYLKYFQKALRLGRRVIIDNSVFELGEAFDIDHFANSLLSVIKDISPVQSARLVTYVIPDVLYKGKETVNKVLEWNDKFPYGGNPLQRTPIPGKRMAVAQGSSYQELTWCFGKIHDKVDIVGISFNCLAFTEVFERLLPESKLPTVLKWSAGRLAYLVKLAKLYKDPPNVSVLYKKAPLHLLGCGTPQEMYYIFNYSKKWMQIKSYLGLDSDSLETLLDTQIFPDWVRAIPILSHTTLGETLELLAYIADFIYSTDTSNPIIHGLDQTQYREEWGSITKGYQASKLGYDEEKNPFKGPGVDFKNNHIKLADLMFKEIKLNSEMENNIKEFRSYCK